VNPSPTTPLEKIALWRARAAEHCADAVKADSAEVRATHESLAQSYLLLIDTEEQMVNPDRGASRGIPCR
jgi:hypothetical protein